MFHMKGECCEDLPEKSRSLNDENRPGGQPPSGKERKFYKENNSFFQKIIYFIKMKFPPLIYGTAWKEDATERVVQTALRAGFRAIDTANQRRHYNEAAVGNAITTSGFLREELFLQSKFTYAAGQNHRLPYDPRADFRTQVRQSCQSSLNHLQTTYFDSYLLHGPSTPRGLSTDDFEVWKEMETLQKEGKMVHLGISNINIEQLKLLYHTSIIKPTFVQNRCYAQLGWDKEIRKFCTEKGIIYQGFSLLTANAFLLPQLTSLADKYNKTSAQVIFRFAQHLSILPLTGTTNEKHMKEDLQLNFDLEKEEIQYIETMAL